MKKMFLSHHFRSLLAGSALIALAQTGLALDPTSDTATYRLTFEATWSVSTHPLDFPPNPHFSGLIGGTHNNSMSFWEIGWFASPGIQSMAEVGSKTLLRGEVETAIAAGTAGEVISGGGISPSPGSVSTVFTVSQDYPLASVVAMLAPSPDWFIGVTRFSLQESGAWVDDVTVSLLAYDAGTDDGMTFTSANQESVPHRPVFAIMDPPLSPAGGPAAPVGTLRFQRLDACPPGVKFCLGDTACPCGNNDPSGTAGCANSTGAGASLSATGTASVAADDLHLMAEGFPPNESGLYFMGAAASSPIQVGDGLACTGGLFRFLPSTVDATGVFRLENSVASAPAGQITAGDTRHFQAWTRDVLCGPPPAPCPSPCANNSNLSNGYSVLFTP